ncbi:MAG: group II truncated hemoglobin [Rhodocyclaceae bacterium]|jgi:hemoglobin|nr:group II truncated hemoglobin [Rhodocyclaceae bacterium]
MNPTSSPYEQLGEAGIARLVERIYHWMAILPEAQSAQRLHSPDTREVQARLKAFLSGWLGGPDLFRPRYGEPCMRRRHMAFPIDSATRNAWMAAFRRALDETVTAPALHALLLAQFQAMADHLRNRADPSQPAPQHAWGCARQPA